MLRINVNVSAKGAKSYYSTADYYTQGQELVGVWKGIGAKQLGLSGVISRDDWDALCNNKNPDTGTTLTARQKATRRVGYDFNFHVPKSVSLLYGLTQDERILDAFREAVDDTMRDMESEMKTRVRKDGRDEDRVTGNMAWGEFIHFTARPVDGVPDPHLHAHCFVFNSTYDDVENRWKAGQFADLKRDAPYFEAMYHSRLARNLAELGLPVARSKKGWEIAGPPGAALKKFSRRTALIEEKAREAGISDPEAKGALGAKTRERKKKNLMLDELREEWASRLSPDETDAVYQLAAEIGGDPLPENETIARDAARFAAEHCFERNSVVPERTLLVEAMKRSVGAASPASVKREVDAAGLITGSRNGIRVVTTPEVLAEEQRMVDFARSGRGTCAPLGDANYQCKREWLNDGQQRAVRHVLTSRDRVTIIRGAAGTGKTSMMQETVEAVQGNGKKVSVLAPSADASRGVLRSEGFADAETVARLLVDQELQLTLRSQVIWIDEAGLVGTRTMTQLFDLAGRLDARVILSGDRKQHGSVERGTALRLLEEEAGIIPAEIRDIKRQRGDYKEAVKALSEGRTESAFRQLDKLGWIKQVPVSERYKLLASDYVSTVAAGKSALVVSPTHLEGEWITDEIRHQLKRSGKLGKGERVFAALKNANLTEAERKDAANYEPGDVLVFHQNAKGHVKGERISIGINCPPLAEAAKFQVYKPDILPIAPGETLRITRNGTTADGKHRLNNGAIFTVKEFDRRGNIVLTNGWKISKDYGHLTHGYVVTSHASQGKTVDRVLIGQSAASFRASSREQFYVSVSRGREQATIYTDDKQSLLDAAKQSDERYSATELVADALRERALHLERMRQMDAALTQHHQPHHERRDLIHDRQFS